MMKLWVKDLRDNRDKQGEGYLQTNAGKNCCLGRCMILCGWTFKGRNPSYGHWVGPDGQIFAHNSTTRLPKEVIEKMGFGPNYDSTALTNIEFMEGRIKSFEGLGEANDDGMSFKQIADWIEDNYKDL